MREVYPYSRNDKASVMPARNNSKMLDYLALKGLSLFSKRQLRSLVGCKCSKTDTVEHCLHDCKLVIVFPSPGGKTSRIREPVSLQFVRDRGNSRRFVTRPELHRQRRRAN